MQKVTITITMEASKLIALQQVLLSEMDFSDLADKFNIYDDSIYLKNSTDVPISLLNLLYMNTSGRDKENIKNQITLYNNSNNLLKKALK